MARKKEEVSDGWKIKTTDTREVEVSKPHGPSLHLSLELGDGKRLRERDVTMLYNYSIKLPLRVLDEALDALVEADKEEPL